MTTINCYVLDRKTLKIKKTFRSADWEVFLDYLTNEKSTFTPIGKVEGIKEGDFLIAKHGSFDKTIGASFKPFYFGVISSFELNEQESRITTCDLYNLCNFQFSAVRVTGADITAHVTELITKYLLNDPGKNLGNIQVVADDSSVSYSYQPSDPPTATNLTEYIVGAFQKYNVVWSVDSLTYAEENALQVNTSVKLITTEIALKNNAYAFLNWEVYVNPGGGSDFNKLVIVDSQTTSMVNPTVLATYYIQEDGGITRTLNDQVRLPVRDKVYIYDTATTDAPLPDDIARSELSAARYSHEITFDLVRDNKILKFDQLEVGILAALTYDTTAYPSVMTGYRVSSSDPNIGLLFGYVRSTLKQVLNNLASNFVSSSSSSSSGGGSTPVGGIWSIENGGTGLDVSPSMLTNLGSTTADDILQPSPRPGVTGILGNANGGLGSDISNVSNGFLYKTTENVGVLTRTNAGFPGFDANGAPTHYPLPLTTDNGGTGISADSKIELLNELGALSMADATPIPAVANLDGYRTHGAYCCNATANAVTVLGIPKDLVRAFRLWVWPSLINSNGQPSPSYWTQLIMDFNGCIWTRQDRSGSEDIWSEWSRIWSSADPPLVLTQTVYGITFVWVKHGRNVVCVWNGTTTQAIASSTVWLTIENTDFQPFATTARGSSTVSASVASSMTMSLDGTIRNAHNAIPQGASPWGSMAYISKT